MIDVSQAAQPMPPAPPPHLEKFGQQMEGVQGADKAAMDQRNAAMLKPMSALSSINASPMPQPPTPQKPPPAPDAASYQKDAMAFASAMAVLGAVAGRFTRTPGGAALQAFGGALKGWQSGNLQAYENAAKQWEQNTKATVENNRMVMDQYKAALQNRKMNIDEQMSQIQLISAQYHDQIMYDAAAAKNYTLVAQIFEKNAEFTEKVAQSAAALQEKRDQQRTKNEENALYWLSPAGQTQLQTLEPSQQAAVKQMIELYASKQQGRPPRSAPAMALSKYIEQNPEATADDISKFQAENAGRVTAERARAGAEPRADSNALSKLTQQQAAINSFEQTAIKNGDVLVQLANKVDATGVPVMEKWIRAGRQATGDPDVATFNTQMYLYRAEVARILTNPNLSGVLSDSARKEVEHFLSGAASAKQIAAVHELLKGDFKRREQSLSNEIGVIRGRLQPGGRAAPAEPVAPADQSGDGGWGKAEVVK